MQKYDIFLIYKHFLLFHFASWQFFIMPVGNFSLYQLAVFQYSFYPEYRYKDYVLEK